MRKWGEAQVIMGIFSSKYNLIGIFNYHDDLVAMIQDALQSRFKVDRVYSPVPEEKIYEMLRMKRSPVRLFTLLGGILGALVGLFLAVYSATQWDFIIQGKPVLGWPSFSLITYEFTLIWAAVFTLIGVLLLGRIPRHVPKDYDSRFTDDKFGLRIQCSGSQRDHVTELMRRHGAIDVYEF